MEFGSLTVFAINGNGVPTLQTDQLNVIAHHLNAINMKEEGHYMREEAYAEFWGGNKKDDYAWPDPIDQINISKLTRNKIFAKEPQEVIDKFVKSEYKQLNRYEEVNMFGTPCEPPVGAKVLP